MIWFGDLDLGKGEGGGDRGCGLWDRNGFFVHILLSKLYDSILSNNKWSIMRFDVNTGKSQRNRFKMNCMESFAHSYLLVLYDFRLCAY